MLKELNPSYGVDVWINKKLEEDIENSYKTLFKSDKLYYYYLSCTNEKCKIKWCGPCGLIPYIKKVQSKKGIAPVLGVTSISNKAGLQKFFDDDSLLLFPEDDYVFQEFWIGDGDRHNNIVCGDRLFIELWDRKKNKVTKDSHKKV